MHMHTCKSHDCHGYLCPVAQSHLIWLLQAPSLIVLHATSLPRPHSVDFSGMLVVSIALNLTSG